MKHEKLRSDWTGTCGAAITVCDREGVILYMNDRAKLAFAEDGGEKLIGRSLGSCHKPESMALIRRLIEEGASNTYTVEKKGMKKLIHQAAWFANGRSAGLVEISIELPPGMPHHTRG